MQTTKKILAMLLCMVMFFTTVPMNAFAVALPNMVERDAVKLSEEESAPAAVVEPMATTDAVKVEHNGETTYYADLQKAFDGFAPSNNTYGGTYVVTLLDDVTGNLNKVLSYPTEALNITLDLNGHTITGDGTTVAVVFNLGSNQAKNSVVTIKDSSGDNSGKITGGKGGVKLDGTDCTLRFEGGTITGNHGASKGGGIFMGAKAKLIMTGGVITGNSVTGSSSANTGYGGGVLANYADILGGVITGNTAYKGSHLQTGRGGGVCTEITRTKGYSTLNIADGVVYGNTAENAGDDVMAQGNGMSSAKFSLIIGTENWYIDGWNGTKAGSGGGQTDRYSAENPVAYTDGGFTGTVNADGSYAGVYNKTLGLKYVAPAEPSVPEYTVTYTDGVEDEEIFADQVYTAKEGDATPAFEGTPAREGYTFIGWAPEVAETVTAEATYVAQWEAVVVIPEMPKLPEDNGSNVTAELVTIICDSDEGHTAKTYGWLGANIVFPKDSEPVWDETLNAWTIGVRIDSIGAYYVGLNFSEEHNGIQHEVVKGEPLTSDEYNRIDTTLVWNTENQLWQTLTGEPFVVHVACQTVPEAPSMGYYLSSLKIKLVGMVGTVEKVWFESLHAETVSVGEVYGSRTEGFFVDVTVTLDSTYIDAFVAKHGAGFHFVYDGTKTGETVTFTMKYTGDTTGELYDQPGSWAADSNTVGIAYLTMVAPDAPDKYGKNVTSELVKVICDSDPNHAALCIDWQHQSTKVRDWVSGVVWSEEENTWVVPVRIDGIVNYYVWLNFEKVYNDIKHELVDENQKCIDTYLKWDTAKQLWVTLDGEPIAVHVCCQTKPTAPTTLPSSFQIQVKADLDGDGIYGENKSNCSLGISELRAVTIPAGSYTLSEVYGSREEGFFVDVTVTLEDGDVFINTWIENCAPGTDFVYNWEKTEKTVTFTLKYNRSLTGTLYGNNLKDWAANFSGYKVGEAYIMPAQPSNPEQKNVTEQLVAIICDSDGERHETVYGKWYPNHCKTLSTSVVAWNEEISAWTVDVMIGGLYIMYVDQLEDANYGTTHELVEDITTVYTTLKWDALAGQWTTLDGKPIELHTTCRTAPLAPAYKQINYQVKVWGDVFDEMKAYTSYIPEDGYVLSDVYGSREEGFFVDVTIFLDDNDVYVSNWNEKKAPEGMEFFYDWQKTEKTITFTLKYNGSLNGTLHGDRHASNTNFDWVLASNGKHFGVVYEASVEPETMYIVFRKWVNGTNHGTIKQAITYGEEMTLKKNLWWLSGYTFDHWNSKRDTDDGKFTFSDCDTVTAEQTYELYKYAMANNGNAYLNAYWQAKNYVLSFDVGYEGGENPESIIVTYNSAIGELPVPTREGYNFVCWVDAEGNEVTADSIYKVAGKSTLTAKWQDVRTFKIVFRFWLNGTKAVIEQEVNYGEAVTLRANTFKRSGYTFDHWNSKRDTDDGKFTFADGETISAEVVNELYKYAMANGGKAYLNAYWTKNEPAE